MIDEPERDLAALVVPRAGALVKAGGIAAVIDWEEALTALRAGHLPCSSSEAAILHLAASLATASPVILRHVITGLDQANLHLVINAVRRAGRQN